MRVLRVKLRRDLRRQRGQFAAIALTIFLGVTLFGATYDAYRNLKASYQEAYIRYHFANLTVSGGSTARIARAARATPGVAAVQTRVQADIPLRIGRTKLLGRVVGMPTGAQPAVNRLEVDSGTYLRAARPNGVLVERHTANHFKLAPGDRVSVGGAGARQPLRIGGVATSPEYYWPALDRQNVFPSADDFGVVFAPEALAERLAGLRRPNQVAIYYRGGVENAALTRRLTALADRAGAASAVTRAEQPSNSPLQQDVDGFQELAILFPLLFLTAAALATAVLMRRLVTAQRPTIGMLRASGYSSRQVVAHFISFGLVVGLAGGVLGALAGLALAGRLTDVYTHQLSIPVSLTSVSPLTAVIGLAFGVATGIASAALAARSAARIPPAEAMRHFVPAAGGRVSLAERLLPPLRRLPIRWRMVLRSPGRNRRRSLAIGLAVVLALTLVLVSWGMVDTVGILIDRQFDQVELQDAQIYFRHPVDRGEVRSVDRTPGVERAEPAAEIPVSLSTNGKRYQTSLVGLERDTQLHGFLLSGGGQGRLPRNGLLVGEALRSRLDISTGDEVTVLVPSTGLPVSTSVKGFVDEPLGTYAYASLGSLRAAAGKRGGAPNSVLVRYAPGVSRARMRARLSALPGVTAFEDTSALRDTVNGYLGFFYVFVGVMLVLGSAMAFVLMFSAITSSISERRTEVATMRASGASFRMISHLITAETVLVTAAGIAPGLIVGYEVARLFMGSFTNDAFSFDLQIRTSTLVLAAVAILLVALLSEWPGLRGVRRLDIAEVVRERSA